MNALVVPSLTESINPRISFLTSVKICDIYNLKEVSKRGAYTPSNCSLSVSQPCCKAMTYAMVWLPLPMRDMPMGVPSRLAML